MITLFIKTSLYINDDNTISKRINKITELEKSMIFILLKGTFCFMSNQLLYADNIPLDIKNNGIDN